MRYVGSKNRIAKYIVPIIEKEITDNTVYIEPFVGGANLIDKVNCSKRYGYDINKYLIALLQYQQSGGKLPNIVTKQEYQEVRNNKANYPDWLVGFIGFCCCFRSHWFAGFADPYTRGCCKRNLETQNLSGIRFAVADYKTLNIPENAVIYCDPPYQDTTGYKDKINYTEFWDTVRKWRKQGAKVFVSSYSAPPDFTCIWQKDIYNALGNKGKLTEKLFV